MDTSVTPIRGQTVIVKNDPGFMSAIARESPDQEELTYSMARSSGKPLISPFNHLLQFSSISRTLLTISQVAERY